jgi:hypothetical protein
MLVLEVRGTLGSKGGVLMTALTHEPPLAAHAAKRFEYRVIDTGKHVEEDLNSLGAQGWKVVGVTTKKQMFIAPPQAIILMREIAFPD